jgi:hypothetical protein
VPQTARWGNGWSCATGNERSAGSPRRVRRAVRRDATPATLARNTARATRVTAFRHSRSYPICRRCIPVSLSR